MNADAGGTPRLAESVRAVKGRSMTRRCKRHPLAVVAVAITAIGVVITALSGLITIVMARRVVTPPQIRDDDVKILDVDLECDEIVLAASDESTMRGRYSLWFERGTGHARVGPIIAANATRVRRTIEAIDFGDLEHASRGRMNGWYYVEPSELGGVEHVVIDTDLGPAPAWLLAASEPSDAWVVQVHGWGARRQEGLRAVEIVRTSGWNSLLVSYRNDGDAPETDDGRYGLGTTEWIDVAAAVRYAVAHGAERVVLMGWSMGGQIVLQTLLRDASAREHVVGVVLDSPAIDWSDILRFQGSTAGLPDGFAIAVAHLLASPASGGLAGVSVPIDLDSLDIVARADEFDVPMLLMHSRDDGFVPIEGSQRFARARPDLVDYVEFGGARHAKLWNYDAARWERLIGSALSRWR